MIYHKESTRLNQKQHRILSADYTFELAKCHAHLAAIQRNKKSLSCLFLVLARGRTIWKMSKKIIVCGGVF